MTRTIQILGICLLCGCVAPEDVPLPLPTALNPPGTPFDTLPRAAAEVETVTAVWDYSGPVDGFRYYTNGALAGTSLTNGFVFVPPAGRWTNEVTAYRGSLESPKSAALIWPPIPTNIVTIASIYVTNLLQITGVTNWSVSFTNPTDTRFYRHEISIRNN